MMSHSSEPHSSEPGGLLLMLKSLWHWDLWAALATCCGVALARIFTNFEPRWESMTPVLILSLGLLNVSWNQYNTIRTRLENSDYGKLIHMIDPFETEITMPYRITNFVAVFSICSSAIAVSTIEHINNYWIKTFILAVTSLAASWLIFGVISLLMLSSEQKQKHSSNPIKA